MTLRLCSHNLVWPAMAIALVDVSYTRDLVQHSGFHCFSVKDAGAFKKGEWGAAIWDELSPGDQDVVIEGKRGLDGFMSTNLDFILRARGIENIALGGFLGNCCVESTMRTAYEKGYKVFTLRDCVASM
eukprot:evm.model.scf_4054.1 EVM.evm.TU.scf_4054.1   scf_4054:3039-4540(-)